MKRASSCVASVRCSTALPTSRCSWLDDDADINADDISYRRRVTSERSSPCLFMGTTHAERSRLKHSALIPPVAYLIASPAEDQITLHSVIVHIRVEIARHAGPADILRDLMRTGTPATTTADLPGPWFRNGLRVRNN